MELLINKIVNNLHVSGADTAFLMPNSKESISYEWLLTCILSTKNMYELSKLIEIAEKTLERRLKSLFPDKVNRGELWVTYVSSIAKLKKCNECGEIKDEVKFHNSSNNHRGFSYMCKVCDNTRRKEYYSNNTEKCNLTSKRHYEENHDYYISRNAKRRSAEILRLPKWADIKLIDLFYSSKPEGLHVDHIIPLQGKFISGLHIHTNLQYLTATENLSKSNSIDLESYNIEHQYDCLSL